MLYANDNEDRYLPHVTERVAPASMPDTAKDRFPYSFRGKLDPYVKSQDLFKSQGTAAWPKPTASNWWPSDYGFHHNESKLVAPDFNANAAWVAWYQNTGAQGGSDFGVNDDHTQSSLAEPARYLLLGSSERADGNASRGGVYPQRYVGTDWNNTGVVINPAVAPPAEPNRQQARLHARFNKTGKSGYPNGGTNIAYADGHAAFINSPDKTWRSYEDNDWRRNPVR